MIQDVDPVRLKAFVRLLALPDPRDLPRRGHVYRYAGDPDRRATRLPGILMAWLQRRHLAVDVEDPPARAVRTVKRYLHSAQPGLRVVRRTATG